MSRKVITEIGGQVIAEGYGNAGAQAAFMLEFKIKEQVYNIVWQVLPSATGNEKAAKIQAATMLYHDVKAKAMAASVLGQEVAFFSYALLPDGRQMSHGRLPGIVGVVPETDWR